MKAATRDVIVAVLRSDTTVQPEAIEAALSVLAGNVATPSAPSKLLSKAEAARRIGYSRSIFYDILAEDATSPNPRFILVPGHRGDRVRECDVNAYTMAKAS